MPRIALITNNAAALPPDIEERYGITLAPMQINFLDGNYEEGSDIGIREFYDRLEREDVIPSTSPPSVSRYVRAFRTLAADHEIILSIHISSALGAAYQNAEAAAQQISEARVVLYDSGMVAIGMGLQVLTAARLIEQGADIDAILAALRRQRSRTLMVFAPATLRYLRNSRRAGPIAAMLANLLGIKPVIGVSDGRLELIDRVRSWDAALVRQLDEAARFCAGAPPTEVGICHTNARSEAEAFAERVRARLPGVQIYIADAGPIMAVHIGPGAIGLATYRP
jgi:DegV family protein with EDD domain